MEMEPDLLRGLSPISYRGLKVYFHFMSTELLRLEIFEGNVHILRAQLIVQRWNLLMQEADFDPIDNLLHRVLQRIDQLDAWQRVFWKNMLLFDQELQYISLCDEEDVLLVLEIKVNHPQKALYVAAGRAEPLMKHIVANAFQRTFGHQLHYNQLYVLTPCAPGQQLRDTVRIADERMKAAFEFNRH